MPKTPKRGSPRLPESEQAAPCVRCGRPTDSKVGDILICDECYVARGSCCPEFGADDLTGE